MNAHNDNLWESKNPHITASTGLQEKFRVNVWAGVLNNRFIEPYVSGSDHSDFYDRFKSKIDHLKKLN